MVTQLLSQLLLVRKQVVMPTQVMQATGITRVTALKPIALVEGKLTRICRHTLLAICGVGLHNSPVFSSDRNLDA